MGNVALDLCRLLAQHLIDEAIVAYWDSSNEYAIARRLPSKRVPRCIGDAAGWDLCLLAPQASGHV